MVFTTLTEGMNPLDVVLKGNSSNYLIMGQGLEQFKYSKINKK